MGGCSLLFNWTANGFLPGGRELQYDATHKNTHHAQTKHSTQSYTNSKGQIKHNEYNTQDVKLSLWQDRLCGLVVRVPGYRSRGSGSIPGATRRNSESGTGSTQPREYNPGATWKKK
jgi:hypothetical protein